MSKLIGTASFNGKRLSTLVEVLFNRDSHEATIITTRDGVRSVELLQNATPSLLIKEIKRSLHPHSESAIESRFKWSIEGRLIVGFSLNLAKTAMH